MIAAGPEALSESLEEKGEKKRKGGRGTMLWLSGCLALPSRASEVLIAW